MKITEYVKIVGVTPLTVRTWFHKGAYQLPTGTIIVADAKLTNRIEKA